jgi:hypothetical protein
MFTPPGMPRPDLREAFCLSDEQQHGDAPLSAHRGDRWVERLPQVHDEA